MGIPVMILGSSGSGKSASMRNLNPDRYSLIEVNGKPLPFRSDKQFVSTDDVNRILRLLQRSTRDLIVIDDSQYIMANEFMRRASDKGYQKFTDIGVSFWQLVNRIQTLPRNRIVYFMHHIEPDGYGGYKAKTIGKMIDEKIALEGMFSIVLRAEKANGQYFFTTQSDGTDPVKSPIGMFREEQIDNDLQFVDDAIRSFYNLQPDVSGNPPTTPPEQPATSLQEQGRIPADEQETAFDEQNTAFQEPNGQFSEQGQTVPETGQNTTDMEQQKRETPPELEQILSQLHNGRPVFSAESQKYYYEMLNNAGSEWVITQAKIAARNFIDEMDSVQANGQNTLFQGEEIR